MKRIIGWTLLVVSAACSGIGVLIIRLSKPELTETQLFLNYWALWVGSGAGMLLGWWLTESEKNSRTF